MKKVILLLSLGVAFGFANWNSGWQMDSFNQKMDSMSNKIDNMESQMRRQQQQQRFERDMDRACQMGGTCISHF